MKLAEPIITDYKKISIFKGLNALRFIAAFLVVIHHGETIRSKNNLINFEWLGLFRNGGNAVTFFFVLSGFLITYLLLKERNKTNTISIKNFYLRRILRIWPLYFLLIIIGTVLLPSFFSIMGVDYEMPYTLGQTWYYFLFFVPGLVAFYYGSHFLQPLWSIGVEEVFYLFWAPLFKFGNRAILQILIMIVVLKSALEILDMTAIENPLFSYILATFKFEAMAIGGLGAYFLFYKGASLTKSILFKVPAQILIFGIIAVYIIFHCNIKSIVWDFFFKTPIISSLFLDFLFLYAILCISVIHNSIIKWRGKVLSFLGEISYGIYMYHMLAIFTVMFFLKKFLVNHPDLLGHIVFYFCVTFLVIGLSTFSKLFFEDYFLRLKKKIEIH